MSTWRRTHVDARAFLVIALATFLTHAWVIDHGMLLNDAGWYFHFGRRVIDGDVPYRDFVFQVGPLPIYVDALFQKLSGDGFQGSLYAAIFVKTLRVFVMWMIVRRIASWHAAALLALYCGLDPTFGWIHHWSTPYSQLFFTASGLCFVIAARAETERATCVALAGAGLCAGLIITCRQSTAIMSVALLLPASLILAARRDSFTPRRFAALWAGFAAAMLLFVAMLAAIGALRPAIQQMFLDAPQKKSVHGIATIIDPVSGGSMVLWARTWWGGALTYLALPALFVAGVMRALATSATISMRSLAVLLVPFLVLVGLLSRFAYFDFYYDVPRTLLTAVSALAVCFPVRLRTWLGIEPLVAVGLVMLPLASDWANELSLPGRGWGDITALIIGAVLVALASTRVSQRAKTGLCAGFAIMGLVHGSCSVKNGLNPFARDIATDGTLAQNDQQFDHPLARGVWINPARKRALEWLASHVNPGSSCFMYGNLTAIYDFLGCENPTRIDTTITDFVTIADAETALQVLEANPPDFLIAQERNFTNPSLEEERADTDYDSPVNPKASRLLHQRLRKLLPRYESVGLISEVLGPELDRQINWVWDGLSATRLYRRRN